jgi:hypothetical protein
MEKLADAQIAELVKQLARSHFDVEEGVERIIWVKKWQHPGCATD